MKQETQFQTNFTLILRLILCIEKTILDKVISGFRLVSTIKIFFFFFFFFGGGCVFLFFFS